MTYPEFRDLGILPTNDFNAVARTFKSRANSIDILGTDRGQALADWRKLCEALDTVARRIAGG